MPTPYELPSIMLRNARYRGHRESEKRLGSHNEQVYDIHRLSHKLREQNELINKTTKEWFSGNVEENEVINNIVVSRSFPAAVNQTMYHVITHQELRKVNSVVVKLNSVTISPNDYQVLHGSIYIDLESIMGNIPTSALLNISMSVEVAERNLNNVGVHSVRNKVRNLDERTQESERKYIEYEDAYE